MGRNLTPFLRTGARNGNQATEVGPTDTPQISGNGQSTGPKPPANPARNDNDEGSSPESHRASDAWSPSSPAGHLRHQSGVNIAAGGPPSGFVIHSQESRDEDPFVSPGRDTIVHRGTDASSRDGYITPSRHSSEPSESNESTAGATTHERTDEERTEGERIEEEQTEQERTEEGPAPRADRSGQLISAENAQALLPPSACVFVAK